MPERADIADAGMNLGDILQKEQIITELNASNRWEAIDELINKLVESGLALMPLDNYGFSKKFGWVNDRFGVSWQINFKG